MKHKKRDFYYESIEKAAELALSAAEYLYTAVSSFDLRLYSVHMEELHRITAAAHSRSSEVTERLYRDLVTPVEREDIYLLVRLLCKLTRSIEALAESIYAERGTAVHPDALSLFEKCRRSCFLLKEAAKELSCLDKSKVIGGAASEIRRIRQESLDIYQGAVRELYKKEKVPSMLLARKDTFDLLMRFVYMCEETISGFELVMIRNA